MNTASRGSSEDITHTERFCNYSNDILISLSKDFTITFFNRQAEKLYNLPIEDSLGKKYDKICSQNKINCKELVNAINDALSNKSQTSVEENLYDSVFIKWKVIPVESLENSKPTVLLIGKNISEEHKNNAELMNARLEENSKNKVINDLENSIMIIKNELRHERDTRISLENLLTHMPGNVYWMDKSCIQLGCNNNVLSMLGISRENYIGKTYEELAQIASWPEGLAERLKQDDIEVMRTGLPKFNVEDPPLPHTNGTFLHLLTSRVPLRDAENNIIGVAGISIDITERKKSEQELLRAKEAAETANKAKTDFVQNMQHDIRTPSAGLWGVLDVLAKAEIDSDKKEALNMAVTASKRLLDLCNDAVEFGDLEGGNTRPQLEEALDIRVLAKSVVELNLPAAFAKDLVVDFKVDSSVPSYIMTDEFRISRILINLLGNAIKFTNEGEISLDLTAKINKEERRGLLTIKIKDTGIGIAQDRIKSIYAKFTRAVASNTNKYPGTGLGLYVVKTFIDELNGDIEVESHENQGSSFILSIPFKIRWADLDNPGEQIDERFTSSLSGKEEEKSPVLKSKSEPTKEKTPFTHELLIIEDDKICLFAEKQLLTAFTNKIDSAENVAEALKQLASKRYDLVISDLGLPDGSGNEIVAKIKAMPESPNYKTPFVAMTAHKDALKHQQAMDAGFAATNTKPLGTDKAVELLKTYPAQGAGTSPKEEGLAVIDLALGMQRIAAKSEGDAIEALGILFETLQEDIPVLQEAEKNNDIGGAREVLHKIRGGLCYSGTPRLEKAFAVLHDEVKRTPELRKIDYLFSLAYDEVKLFSEQFKEMVWGKRN